ncbi:KilA-N domain-containing protein [bacterium]|nr:KilA-N domain-containing protein [Candidatus Neomarinimicrobiota bacterium]MCK5681455.1 KilA-N domain-containing protein [bacterium]
MKATINAKGREITVISKGNADDYISLTDIARYKNPDEPKDVVKNWMRNHNTVEFIGLWEQLNNPDFKGVEFDSFIREAGSNAFTLSPQKWISTTNAIGITSKSGRYGGTYAHKDIAFEFASWISTEFKLYIIKDYQRLKDDENSKISLEWNVNRIISKINYKIHTDAIKQNLIPVQVTSKQKSFTYASEADLLNVALFGKTAKEWRDDTSTDSVSDKKGNIRDYSTIHQLIVLSNIESMNAELIKQGIAQNQRLIILNKMAIEQMTSILASSSINKLGGQTKSTEKKLSMGNVLPESLEVSE